MPTSANFRYSPNMVDPYMNADDAMASMIDVAIAPSQTLAAGTVLGQITATGKFKAYAAGNSDGSQVARGILRRGVTTDASGNITGIDIWGSTALVAPMYTQGIFRTTELVGLDAAGLGNMSGHLITGTVADGVAEIG